MTEPTFSTATEDTYDSLARYLRTADRVQGSWPLKRYLSSVLDQLGIVDDLYKRADYLSPDEFGADNRPLTLYTNLEPNGSFEIPTPLPGLLNLCTGERVPVEGVAADGGEWEFEATCLASGTGTGFAVLQVASDSVAVPSGAQTLTVSFDAKASVTGRPVSIFAIFYDATNTQISSAIGGFGWQTVPYVGPGHQHFAYTFPVPPAAVTVWAGTGVFDAAVVEGETLRFDCLQVVAGSIDYPYRTYSGVATGETSELVTPETADDAWLPWLAQLVGIRLNPDLSRQAKVDTIRSASAGWQGGTKAAVAAAAKSALTGSRYVGVYDHSTEAGVGAGGEWDVLLITRATETPDSSAVLAAVVAAGAKPAGVVLHHLSYNATWAQIEAQYPTWADWQAAGTWQRIEEAGL